MTKMGSSHAVSRCVATGVTSPVRASTCSPRSGRAGVEMFEGPGHTADLLGLDQHNPVSVWAWLPGPEVVVHAAPDFPVKRSVTCREWPGGLVSKHLEKSVLSESAPRALLGNTVFLPGEHPASVQLFPVTGRPGSRAESSAQAGPVPGRRGPGAAESSGEGQGAGGLDPLGSSVSPLIKGLSWSEDPLFGLCVAEQTKINLQRVGTEHF